MNPYGEMSLPNLSFTVPSTLNIFSGFRLGEGSDWKKKGETISSERSETLSVNPQNHFHEI